MTSEPATHSPERADAVATASVVRIDGLPYVIAPHACFACGELSEHGIHLRLHADDEACRTDFELGPRFQGWDGIAHGGIVTTVLDEVQAWSIVARGAWGVTARMAVDFRLPVPLGTPLRAVGRVTSSRRRIFETAGEIVEAASGRVLASATATFLATTGAQAEALRSRYQISRVADEYQRSSGS